MSSVVIGKGSLLLNGKGLSNISLRGVHFILKAVRNQCESL